MRAEGGEQPLGFLRREHGGRLVEDEKLRVLHQAAHDLDPLPLADRELPDLPPRVERQAIGARHLGEPVGDARHGLRPVEGEGDVLGDRQRLEQGEVLEDHADPERAGGAGAGQRHLLAAPQDAAGIGLQQAVQSFTRVDLPAPFSPSRACTSPGATVRSTWSFATSAPNRFTSCWAWTRGAGMAGSGRARLPGRPCGGGPPEGQARRLPGRSN
jgi:hypothetical protein